MIRFTITRKFPNRPLQISYYSCNYDEASRILSNSGGKVKLYGPDSDA